MIKQIKAENARNTMFEYQSHIIVIEDYYEDEPTSIFVDHEKVGSFDGLLDRYVAGLLATLVVDGKFEYLGDYDFRESQGILDLFKAYLGEDALEYGEEIMQKDITKALYLAKQLLTKTVEKEKSKYTPGSVVPSGIETKSNDLAGLVCITIVKVLIVVFTIWVLC